MKKTDKNNYYFHILKVLKNIHVFAILNINNFGKYFNWVLFEVKKSIYIYVPIVYI